MNEPLVEDAIGPDLPLHEAAAAMALGVVSLLLAGVLAAVLGEMADEHRLSAAGIGFTATYEALSMGLATAAAGVLLKPKGLRWIAIAAALTLAACDLLSMRAAGTGIMLIRTAAGVPEGVLLWITIGMIARTRVPERWAGYFFTVLTASQLALALLYAEWVLPVHGADGGFLGLAIASLAGVAIAFGLPKEYAALPAAEESGGVPPPRGIFALFATLIYIAGTGAVGIFLQPLAHEAGLSADVARTAIWVSLAAQIGGGAAATALSGHIRYFTVFALSAAVVIGTWGVYLLHPPAWAFIAATAAGGFVGILLAPFLVPMTIEADPSRRAAVLSGSTQVLAGALGPFAASFVVADDDVHGAIALGSVTLLVGLALIAGLHFSSPRNEASV